MPISSKIGSQTVNCDKASSFASLHPQDFFGRGFLEGRFLFDIVGARSSIVVV